MGTFCRRSRTDVTTKFTADFLVGGVVQVISEHQHRQAQQETEEKYR
jgi:hypothetical protein